MMKTRDQILITVTELKKMLGAPKQKILHVQMDPVGTPPVDPVAASRHFIPGAMVFDIEKYSDPNQSLPHMMPAASDFEKMIRAIGINVDDDIVVYDEKGIYSSPRARFMFLSMGHENVRVLDGGLPAWKEAGYSTVEKPMAPTEGGTFVAKKVHHSFVDRESVLQNIRSRDSLVFDARSEDRFHGRVDEPRVGLRRGHVPGAQTLAFTRVLNGTKLKSDEELKTMFEALIPNGTPSIFYCGSGVTACISALGAEVAGVQQIKIYDGSWSEWGGNPDLLIESSEFRK